MDFALVGVEAVLDYLGDHFGDEAVRLGPRDDGYSFEVPDASGNTNTLFVGTLVLGQDRKRVYSRLARSRVASQLRGGSPVAIVDPVPR